MKSSRNKSTIMIIALLLILSLTVVSFGETYEDQEYDFTLKYPDGWIIDKTPPQPDVHVSFYPENNHNTSIAISIQGGMADDDINTYSNADVEAYNEQMASAFNSDDMVALFGKTTVTSVKIKRTNGTYIQTDVDIPNHEMRMIMLATTMDSTMYVMTITTSYAAAEKYAKEYSDALISFSYNGKVTPPKSSSNSTDVDDIIWFGKIVLFIMTIIVLIVSQFLRKKTKKDIKVDTRDNIDAYFDKENRTTDKEEKQLIFSDFLNSFLNHHSEEFGSYYGKWNNDVVTLMDSDNKKCHNKKIYKLIHPKLEDYGYMLNDELEIVEC